MAIREGVAAHRGVCSRTGSEEVAKEFDCARRPAQRESCGRVIDVLRAAPTRAGGDRVALMLAVCVCVGDTSNGLLPALPLGLPCCWLCFFLPPSLCRWRRESFLTGTSGHGKTSGVALESQAVFT